MRVHFICNGNAYRSRLAQAYFQSLNTGIETISSGARADACRAGNTPGVVEYTADFLRRNHIDPSGLPTEPVQLTQEMLRTDDITVIMKDAVENARLVVVLPADTRVWDISDVGGQEMTDEQVRIREAHTEQIFQTIRQLVDSLVAELLQAK